MLAQALPWAEIIFIGFLATVFLALILREILPRVPWTRLLPEPREPVQFWEVAIFTFKNKPFDDMRCDTTAELQKALRRQGARENDLDIIETLAIQGQYLIVTFSVPERYQRKVPCRKYRLDADDWRDLRKDSYDGIKQWQKAPDQSRWGKPPDPGQWGPPLDSYG
jgi:hypothetical protein